MWRRHKLSVLVQNNAENVEGLLCDVLVDGKFLSEVEGTEAKRTLFSDCRTMPEPLEPERCMHFGTHPDMLANYSSSNVLAKHVEQLQSQVQSARTAQVRCLTIVVFDAKGRWSAMAVGKAVAEIALRSPRLTLQKVSFLTDVTDSDCSMCDRCAFWSRAWVRSNQAVTNIWQMYTAYEVRCKGVL